jgi:hypothetical protein
MAFPVNIPPARVSNESSDGPNRPADGGPGETVR